MANLQSNSNSTGIGTSPVHGMIDANAYHSSLNTWPLPLMDKKTNYNQNIINAYKNRSDNANGNDLITSNTTMYNLIKQLEENRGTDILSLMMVSTMDMELAHIDGYGYEPSIIGVKPINNIFIYQENNGKVVYKKKHNGHQIDVPNTDKNAIQKEPLHVEMANDAEIIPTDRDEGMKFHRWKIQVGTAIAAAESHPLRFFPLFSYDPRRYRYADGAQRDEMINGCGSWKDPFERIIGHEKFSPKIKKLWLGFSMNPLLGFRPFDELCEFLPNFYFECAQNSIPILAYSAIEEIFTHEVQFYKGYDNKVKSARIRRGHLWIKDGKNKWPEMHQLGFDASKIKSAISDNYAGSNEMFLDTKDDHFYRNYGHPRNWRPVLECFPDLHLCLSHFGGNIMWESGDSFVNNSRHFDSNESKWINSVIELTRDFRNVYVDISGLNIDDERVGKRLWGMLNLIKECENCDLENCPKSYKFLKNKLIFGSGGYLNMSYKDRLKYVDYCRKFKELFDCVDTEWGVNFDDPSQTSFWKYASLVNPWNFYALSEYTIRGQNINKIQIMHDALPKSNDRTILNSLISFNNKIKPPDWRDNKGTDETECIRSKDITINGIFANGEKHYEKIVKVLDENLNKKTLEYKRDYEADAGEEAFKLFEFFTTGQSKEKLKIARANYIEYESKNMVNGGTIKYSYYTKRGFFNPNDRAIYTNIEEDLKRADERRGDYLLTIHELWHNIDFLTNAIIGSKKDGYFSHFYAKDLFYRTIIEKDIPTFNVNNNVDSRKPMQEFYKRFCVLFMNAQRQCSDPSVLDAYNKVFDILDGARCVYNNKKTFARIIWGRNTSEHEGAKRDYGIRDSDAYWLSEESLASECFAHFGSIRGGSTSVAINNVIRKYLPETYMLYNKIIKYMSDTLPML